MLAAIKTGPSQSWKDCFATLRVVGEVMAVHACKPTAPPRH